MRPAKKVLFMNIEEKAKAYDEALEKVKPLYERAKKDDSPIWATYEHLFPQLAESEDERIRRDIIHYILYKADGVSEEQEHSWIAYLEKQKEQKPAEWSEEDEAILSEIISFFRDGTVKLQHDLTLYANWLENRLISLRPQPHWKPSEEQMKAIENVIKCELSAGLHTRANILQTLQNDLKKL